MYLCLQTFLQLTLRTKVQLPFPSSNHFAIPCFLVELLFSGVFLANSSTKSGVDPGFFLGGGAPLRNDVADRCGKHILKANTKKASYQGGCAPPAPSP